MYIEVKITISLIDNIDFHLNADMLCERMRIEGKISTSPIDNLDFHLNADTLNASTLSAH